MPKKPRTHKEGFDRSMYFSNMIERRDIQDARNIRNTTRWRMLRQTKANRDPLCEDPLGHHEFMGEVKTVQDVHHIVPIHLDASRAFVMDNLMSVCKRCHMRIEETCANMGNRGSTPHQIREALRSKGQKERGKVGWADDSDTPISTA